ncbi:MAG: ATP-binding protein [Bacteroidia bacterium]
METAALKRLVLQGEGDRLEFKLKANHPDKIARELVAFANTDGGILLVGVDDDGTIYGSKTIDEEAYVIRRYLEDHCRPRLICREEVIDISARKQVLALHVSPSSQKPHFLHPHQDDRRVSFVRSGDMSITASREMIQLMRHREQGVSLRFGDPERVLLAHLESVPNITLDQTQKLLKTTRRDASIKLVLMVRAGLLRIHPSEKGDYFSLAEEAFGF